MQLVRAESLDDLNGGLPIHGGTEVVPLLRDRIFAAETLVDVPDEHLTNLGSKGIGEPPIIPVAAAIANAIRDATGADVRSLPITRAEMLAAIADSRRRSRLEEPLRR